MRISQLLGQSQAELFAISGAKSVLRSPKDGPEIQALRRSIDPGTDDGKLRLHVGGKVARPGWKILDIEQRPEVDFVGNCCDLSQFSDASVSAIYASHVLEHLRYRKELTAALGEFRRVLAPGSPLLVSVPDFQSLCRMFLNESIDLETRCFLMRAIFGAQQDEHDEHKVGLWDELLVALLRETGFADVLRVPIFGIFRDASTLIFRNVYVSLNLIAR